LYKRVSNVFQNDIYKETRKEVFILLHRNLDSVAFVTFSDFEVIIFVFEEEKAAGRDVAKSTKNIDVEAPAKPVVIQVDFALSSRVFHKDFLDEILSTYSSSEDPHSKDRENDNNHVGQAHEKGGVIAMLVKSVSQVVHYCHEKESNLQGQANAKENLDNRKQDFCFINRKSVVLVVENWSDPSVTPLVEGAAFF